MISLSAVARLNQLTRQSAHTTCKAALWPSGHGCASVPGWSGAAGGLAVSTAARLGGAVHPCRRPGPRGEPKRGGLASCVGSPPPPRLSGARQGCASVPSWSGGAGGLAVSTATRLGGAVHPCRRPWPRGEPKRGRVKTFSARAASVNFVVISKVNFVFEVHCDGRSAPHLDHSIDS